MLEAIVNIHLSGWSESYIGFNGVKYLQNNTYFDFF